MNDPLKKYPSDRKREVAAEIEAVLSTLSLSEIENRKNRESVLIGIDNKTPLVTYVGSSLKAKLKEGSKHADMIGDSIMVDLYYSLYLPTPVIKEKREDTLHYKLVKSFTDMPIIAETRAITVVNALESTALTVEFCRILLEELVKMKESADALTAAAAAFILENLSDILQGEGQGGSGDANQNKKGSGQGNQPQQGKGQGRQPTKAEIEAIQNAIRKAFKEAAATAAVSGTNYAKAAHDIKNLAQGGQAAGTGSTISFGADMDKVLELARDMRIRMLLEKLDGMPKIPFAKNRRYGEDKNGVLIGTDMGNDITRVMAHELAMPDEIFYAKLAHKQLSLKRTGFEKQPGEIYVLMDKSASMSESGKDLWSKSVALALYVQSKRDKRDFSIRFFDSGVHELRNTAKSSMRDKGRELEMIEYIGKVNPDGGTDIQGAIGRACQDIVEKKGRNIKEAKNSIIVITDGESAINAEQLKEMLEKANASLNSVIIFGKNEQLRMVSDSYIEATELSGKEAKKIVDSQSDEGQV